MPSRMSASRRRRSRLQHRRRPRTVRAPPRPPHTTRPRWERAPRPSPLSSSARRQVPRSASRTRWRLMMASISRHSAPCPRSGCYISMPLLHTSTPSHPTSPSLLFRMPPSCHSCTHLLHTLHTFTPSCPSCTPLLHSSPHVSFTSVAVIPNAQWWRTRAALRSARQI